MSKVNFYLDSKEKARHRMRRYQTAHKKLSRARKYDRREYSRYCGLGGYYVEREKVIITHRPAKDFGGRIIYIPKLHYTSQPIFVVKHIDKDAKYVRNQAARRMRRLKIDDDSVVYCGALYKKVYDVEWSLD